MTDVIRLRPTVVPDEPASDPDVVLEAAKGEFTDVLVIGWNKSGDFQGHATTPLGDGGDVLWLIETFKAKLMLGDFGGDDQ